MQTIRKQPLRLAVFNQKGGAKTMTVFNMAGILEIRCQGTGHQRGFPGKRFVLPADGEHGRL